MITHADMREAFTLSMQKRNELQAKLRAAAVELVREYELSLKVDAGDNRGIVTTGVISGDFHEKRPVSAIELDQDAALRFVITTVIDNSPLRKFVVAILIKMRGQGDTLSVEVQGDPVPAIVLGEEVQERFYEVIEKIQQAVMIKIQQLA